MRVAWVFLVFGGGGWNAVQAEETELLLHEPLHSVYLCRHLTLARDAGALSNVEVKRPVAAGRVSDQGCCNYAVKPPAALFRVAGLLHQVVVGLLEGRKTCLVQSSGYSPRVDDPVPASHGALKHREALVQPDADAAPFEGPHEAGHAQSPAGPGAADKVDVVVPACCALPSPKRVLSLRSRRKLVALLLLLHLLVLLLQLLLQLLVALLQLLVALLQLLHLLVVLLLLLLQLLQLGGHPGQLSVHLCPGHLESLLLFLHLLERNGHLLVRFVEPLLRLPLLLCHQLDRVPQLVHLGRLQSSRDSGQ